MPPIPLIRPSPCRLSEMSTALRGIEDSGIFSNYGPLNTRFEQRLTAEWFTGAGECLTVCNATIGLMMAIHATTALHGTSGRRYALMPSFTFAATAHAAIWCGLTPLFCDIDAHTWLPCHQAEAAMIDRLGDDIAVIVPCATFGACLDLDHYVALSRQSNIPVVIDAAPALGSLDAAGRPFAAGCPLPVVFSMHVTKAFAVGEGGVIHADHPELMRNLRAMGNFGFDQTRSATGLGLNAKLSEVSALLALAKLDELDQVVTHRTRRLEQYRAALPGWTFQQSTGQRQAIQFVPVLPPPGCCRDKLRAALAEHEIGSATYFSPHLAEQPYFQPLALAGDLPRTESVAQRILALPMSDTISVADVDRVCSVLRDAAAATSLSHAA